MMTYQFRVMFFTLLFFPSCFLSSLTVAESSARVDVIDHVCLRYDACFCPTGDEYPHVQQ